MSNCPACKNGKLTRVGDTRQCNDAECGYIEQIKTTKAQKWLLKIANNDRVYWRRVYFDNLPTFIAHEYRRLWMMARRPNVFCMVYQLKDVCEVLIKFPVLCAAAYLQSEDIDEKLVEKPLALGDWQSICKFIIEKHNGEDRYNLPPFLRNILEGIYDVFNKSNVAQSRNDYLGHGAMGFEDNQEYRNFGENLISQIAEYLGKALSDYAKLSVTVNGVEFKGWRIPKNIDANAAPILHIEGKEYALDPYIVNSGKHGLLFFDYYAQNKSKNNQIAQGLNYMTGGGRKRFVAPHYCEIYNRKFQNIINTVDKNAPVDGDTMLKQLDEVLTSLNAAENFVRPDYIIKWLSGKINDAKGSVNLLMMERGMGKTSFSYAIASGSVSEFNNTFVATYYCGQSQIQSDFIMGINTALAEDISEKKTGAFVRLERDSKDKKANMLAALKYFREQHLKWHGKSKLMLIIDGLDELPMESAGLFDFLPNAEDMPDDIYILLTSRNPERENLSAHIVRGLSSVSASNRMTVSADVKTEHSAENTAVLEQYATNKIKVLSGGKMVSLKASEVKKIVLLSRGTFLNLKLYAKLAESGIAVKDLPELEDEALFERYLEEIKKYYGEKLFGEAITVLYAIITARENLTINEIAWLSGEKHVTIKLLSFIKDFGALLRTTRDGNRGAVVSAASERYREYVERTFPEKRAELAEIFTDMLNSADIEGYTDENGNYQLPDGLIYIAAYLPTVLDEISEKLLNKVYNDDKKSTNINNCIKNSRERYILSRRANMGEVWCEYCEKVGFYEKQLDFINISGNCYSTMCDYNRTLEFRNKRVQLSEEYFASGKVDENYRAKAYSNRGVTYRAIGKPDKALEDYNKCIEIMERLHDDGKLYDENDLATAYMNRGITYRHIGEYDKSLEDYRKCIEIMERLYSKNKLYDENDLAKAYSNRGVTYDDIGKPNEALEDYGKCIEIREKLHRDNKLYDENDLATAYMNRGVAYQNTGDYDKSLDDYGKCIEIREKLRDKGKLYDLDYLASAMLNKEILLVTGFKDIGGALALFNEAIAILEAEKQLSYSANDTLRRLYEVKNLITGNPEEE